MLNPREEKMLALAIDPGSQPGEADNAAVAFFRSLRKRSITLEQLKEGLGALNGSGAPPPVISQPDFGTCVFPWGKHKGAMFMDIPPSYLTWAIDWIEEEEERAKKMKSLLENIKSFLKQISK